MNKLNIVDMFCGGGGESTGLIEAAHEYNFDINMSAINHWERAIETHSQNYPFAEHRCENVQHIEPNTLAASKNCDLMWASPGCQHFSTARGGKPRSEDMRSPAWEVLRFAEELRPKRIIIENVPEFQTWGPLDPEGRVINELAAATGFPKDYKFTGTKVEVVKQIGNAVPPNFAKAMFSQILSEMTA